jgi:DegV family protein with EDD domain
VIGICTDSNSQLPATLVERYDVEVVPVTVTVDDTDYLEGVDLDPDGFYEMLSAPQRPVVSTSPPSSGQFAAAYESLLQRGCDEILSIHVAATASGTLNSARLATRSLPVPVRLVDSGTAGFGVSCCVWAAGEAVAHGATLDEAVQCVELLAPNIGTVFVVGQPEFVGAGKVTAPTGVPVVAVHAGRLDVVANVSSRIEAIEAMTTTVVGWGPRLNVAVGLSDRAGEQFMQSLAKALQEPANILEVMPYRIGPSVGAYAGAGTVACFMFPAV